MEKYLLIILLCFFLYPKVLFSQNQDRSNFHVNVNYLFVKGNVRGYTDKGIGVGVEYHFPLVKSIGLDGLGGIGYERLLNCELCQSEWFKDGYWAGIGLSKRFFIKNNHQFMAQVRYRYVGFEREEPGLLELDGTVVRWEKAYHPQDLLGFRLGYFIPIKTPIVLSYTYENGVIHRMNSISVGFHF